MLNRTVAVTLNGTSSASGAPGEWATSKVPENHHLKGIAMKACVPLRIAWLALLSLALLLPAGGPVHAQPQTYTISGTVYFDRNGNGRRDADEPLLDGIQVAGPRGTFAVSVDGSYRITDVLPSTFQLQASLPGPNADQRPVIASAARTVTVSNADLTGIDFGLAAPPPPHDTRYFPQTGYRIDSDIIWNYFQARGGLTTFGYPVSRTFPFLGFWVQIFQREIIQLGVGGNVARPMNLLDPDLMPITSINFSPFPAFDPTLASQAPNPSRSTYATDVVAFVQQHAPDTFDSLPVSFYQTFVHTVSLQMAFPNGGGNPALLPLLNLEIWGLPTSQPAYDPHNHNFVYLRFQRGIMHYDAGCNCTQGILLADTFKSVLTGQNLPADVTLQMASSPYLKLYQPAEINSVARVPMVTTSGPTTTPRVQGYTNLAFAFLPARS